MKKMFLVCGGMLLVASLLLPAAPVLAQASPPDDPTAPWTVPDDGKEIAPQVDYSQLVVAPTPLPGARPAISASLVDSSGQDKSQIVASEKWFLVIEANMPGRLSLYEYRPSGSSPSGRWLIYRWRMPSAGKWRFGPFSAALDQPEGQHAWRIWLDTADGATGCTVGWRYQRSTALPQIKSFRASAESIKRGEAAVLSWEVVDAITVTIDNGIGKVDSRATTSVSPSVTTTYTLTAANTAGSSTAQCTVTVAPPLGTSGGGTGGGTEAGGVRTGERQWLTYALWGLLAVAGVAIGFLLARGRRAAPATVTAGGGTEAKVETGLGTERLPTEPAGAKLVMPDGSEVALTGAARAFGRADFSNMVSSDNLGYISRRHLVISFENGQFYVEDLDSANGTRLNGVEIKGAGKKPLKDGDIIELAGVMKMTFRWGG